MAWFGKSEEELKNWQQKLDAIERTLNGKQAELDQRQSDLTNRNTIAKAKSEELAKKDMDICSLEKKVTQRELEAKNGFVKEQRIAFKEAIEVQLKELDDRDYELRTKQNDIESQLSTLKKLEGDLAKKERSLKEKELTAENGFADQNKFALREVEKREAECKTLETYLQDREEAVVLRHQEQENKAEELRKREVAIAKAEQERDEGFNAERKKLDDDLVARRFAVEKDLSEKQIKEFNSLEKLLSDEVTKRREALNKELSGERSQFEGSLKTEKNAVFSMKEKLNSRTAELDEQKDDLEYQKQRLQSRKESLEERETNLNSEVDVKVIERKQSFENEKSTLNDEIARLRESIKTSSALISNFEELKHKLGDEDPATVLLKLKTYEEEIKKLREDLATRPTQEMQEAFERLKSEKENAEREKEKYKEDFQQLNKSQLDQNELESENDSLRRKNKTLADQRDNIEAHNNQLQADIKRLQSAYEREADREARVRDIEQPYIQKELPRASVPKKEKQATYELQWLDEISRSCIDYGLRFPRRILHAFHTALKTSEWSPMTVLAGVSGTGKSELPRLYSHFGGINFLSLSVQPNWDSQESMLGFFNSIDNKFDAQPVLRLLAQSQKAQVDDYPGLEDVMSLILMDEMNLAHVELYFAEFLSKLELRRGRKGNEVPCLEVKLGAGIQQYDLPLGRNVLWAGTMNQDETTKSLSDKVLDRGTVINFPRPTKLERRKKLSPLGRQSPLLNRKVWESWWVKESNFTDGQIAPFKQFIEKMNTYLSKVGRAMGHRVWQSIEYYMANYPDVLAAQEEVDVAKLDKAMKIAFEDQLVQKVMPKIRGIETRGKSKAECLDKIKAMLVNEEYAIVDDFDLACELGYGQFMWNSANYLNVEVEEEHTDNTVSDGKSTKIVTEQNPLEIELQSKGLSDQAIKALTKNYKSMEEIRRLPNNVFKTLSTGMNYNDFQKKIGK